MSIMPCYNDERSVENELGGKWELLYEYTFDESHAEGFEFPKDIDGTPLNLNGLYVVIRNEMSTNVVFSINGREIVNANFSYTENQETNFMSQVHNGLHWFQFVTRHTIDTGASVNVNTYPRSIFFADSITNFNLAFTGSVGANVKFYALRGV